MSKRVTLSDEDIQLIIAMIEEAWKAANVFSGPHAIASKERLNQLTRKMGRRIKDPKTNQYI